MGIKRESKNPITMALTRSLVPAWHWLTEPSPLIQEAERRRQARLLATLLLFLLALTTLSSLIQLFTVPGFATTFKVLVGAFSVLAVAYGLSRTKYYKWAACITAIIPSVVVFINAFFNPTDVITFAFLTVGVLICSIFCSVRETVMLAIANIAVVLLLPTFEPQLFSGEALAGPTSFLIIMSILILVAAHHRNQIEKDRQADLTENNERFRQLTETISEVFWLAAPEMQQLLYVSPSYAQIWGRSSQSLLERPVAFLEAIHPDDREHVRAAIDKRIRESYVQGQYDLEYRILRPDGSERWILDRAFPVFNDLGDVYRVAGVARDVTERQIAREKLRFQAKLLDSVRESVIATDLDGHVLYWGNGAEALYGYSAEEVMGRLITFIVEPDSEEAEIKRMEQVFKRGLWNGQYWQRRKDGTPFWADTIISLITDEQGQPQGLIGADRDITDRKQAEEVIITRAQQQAAVARLGQLALTGGSLTDLMDEIVTTVAETMGVDYCKILELLPNEDAFLLRAGVGWQTGLVGQARVEAGPGSQAGYTLQTDEPVIVEELRSESRFQESLLLREHNIISGISLTIQGQPEPFGVLGVHTAQPCTFSQDDLHFVQAIANILAQAVARKQVQTALQHSEAYFRSLIENALDITAVVNRDGTVRYLSPSVESILGYRPDWLIGQNPFDLIHPDDLPGMLEKFGKVRQVAGNVSPLEVRIRHHDHSYRTLEANAHNLLDDPIMAGIVVNARDISERKQLEGQFIQAQKMEAIGRLAGGVAHDFNNLLTVITGYSELLTSRPLEDQTLAINDIEQIKKAAERAASLTRQLLAFSRQQVLQPRPLNLNSVIAEITDMMQRLIGEDVELVTDLDQKLGIARVDQRQMEQVILNLAINARDAMPDGGILTIETFNIYLDEEYARYNPAVQNGHYVMLTLSDTGIGMDTETVSHIFEPFYTSKEQGQGTGLGLAMVHGTVSQSGGHIWVYSEPGQGTTFKIYLPQVETTVKPVVQTAPSVDTLLGTETILVVEDEPMVRELTRRTLLKYGYKVLEASDGIEALKKYEQHQAEIDLVLTDLVMPGGLSGRMVANHITSQNSETRVIFMSGYSNNVMIQRGIIDSDTAFLQKPFTPQTLVYKVREVLNLPGPK